MRHKGSGNRPGQTATAKYGELSKAWRRRARKKFLLVAAVFAVPAVVANVAAARWHSWIWFAGWTTGAVMGLLVALLSSPPAWIENWQDGAWGEEWTAKALAPLLREGGRIVHDLPANYGSLDHVVVGPGGVFLLDSKRWHGRVSVDRDVAVIQRIEDPDMSYRYDGARHVRGQAREVHERVLAGTRARVWVTPVVVIWAEFPDRVAGVDCIFVHGDALADWLRSQPKRVAPNRVEQLASVLARSPG